MQCERPLKDFRHKTSFLSNSNKQSRLGFLAVGIDHRNQAPFAQDCSVQCQRRNSDIGVLSQRFVVFNREADRKGLSVTRRLQQFRLITLTEGTPKAAQSGQT